MKDTVDKLENQLKGILGSFYDPVIKAGKVILIIIAAMIIVRIGTLLIQKFFEKQKNFSYKGDNKKLDTTQTLLISVFRYGTYIMAVVIILTDVFRMQSILAAAGVGGVAIGFGAQSLIKDIISGFFIIMEDQYVVGDLITIENMTGTVEQMELRVTRLRNFNGDLHIIPNGEIKRVTNHSRGNKAVVVDVPLAYSVDVEKAHTMAEEVCVQISGEYPSLPEPPKVLGITAFGTSNMTLRIFARANPEEYLELERRIRLLIKERFDKAGIQFYDRDRFLSRQHAKEGDWLG